MIVMKDMTYGKYYELSSFDIFLTSSKEVDGLHIIWLKYFLLFCVVFV